jgi:hypothetical protein
VALLLVVAVYNLNPASFAYTRGGHTDVTYLNVEVGGHQDRPRHVLNRNDVNISLMLTL